MYKRALLVVDIQNDFIDGSLGTPEAIEIIPKVKEYINEFNKIGDTVIFTQDTHNDDYLDTLEGKNLPIPHCIKGTHGWEIHKDIIGYLNNDDLKEYHVEKNRFGYTDWWFCIEPDIKEIILVGLCTDICVISNALILKAFYPNAIIKIVKDATAGTTPEAKEAALLVAKSCQIDII